MSGSAEKRAGPGWGGCGRRGFLGGARSGLGRFMQQSQWSEESGWDPSRWAHSWSPVEAGRVQG